VRKFFVEAKKPFVDLKEDPAPAYQLRRYAWSAKLPVSILTDFEEFVVYDTRIRPHEGDKPATHRRGRRRTRLNRRAWSQHQHSWLLAKIEFRPARHATPLRED
jgi:hypothetical protein